MGGRNWWKIAFFGLLIVCELMREIIVVQSKSEIHAYSTFGLSWFNQGFVYASGAWRRFGPGEDIAPNAVRIECVKYYGICVEASSSFMNGTVFAPNIGIHEAKFSENAISYTVEHGCVSYKTSINRVEKTVLSRRERLSNADPETCSKLEGAIDLYLASGPARSNAYDHALASSFIPIISTAIQIFGSKS